jgi:hypothetical protein
VNAPRPQSNNPAPSNPNRAPRRRSPSSGNH